MKQLAALSLSLSCLLCASASAETSATKNFAIHCTMMDRIQNLADPSVGWTHYDGLYYSTVLDQHTDDMLADLSYSTDRIQDLNDKLQFEIAGTHILAFSYFKPAENQPNRLRISAIDFREYPHLAEYLQGWSSLITNGIDYSAEGYPQTLIAVANGEFEFDSAAARVWLSFRDLQNRKLEHIITCQIK